MSKNDGRGFKMIWYIIYELVVFAIILPITIYAHEYGHVVQLKKYGYEKKVKYSKEKKCFYVDIPKSLTITQKEKVIESGILGGLLILILGIFFLKILFVPLVLIYIYGSIHDIKELIRLNKISKKFG